MTISSCKDQWRRDFSICLLPSESQRWQVATANPTQWQKTRFQHYLATPLYHIVHTYMIFLSISVESHSGNKALLWT